MALMRAVDFLMAAQGEDGLWCEDAVSAEILMAFAATDFHGEFARVQPVYRQGLAALVARREKIPPLVMSHLIRLLNRDARRGSGVLAAVNIAHENTLCFQGNEIAVPFRPSLEAAVQLLAGPQSASSKTSVVDVGECAALLDALFLVDASMEQISGVIQRMRVGGSPTGVAVAYSAEKKRPNAMSVLEMSPEMLYWYSRAWFPFEDPPGRNWRNDVVIHLLETQTYDGGWGGQALPLTVRLRFTAFAMQTIILARW